MQRGLVEGLSHQQLEVHTKTPVWTRFSLIIEYLFSIIVSYSYPCIPASWFLNGANLFQIERHIDRALIAQQHQDRTKMVLQMTFFFCQLLLPTPIWETSVLGMKSLWIVVLAEIWCDSQSSIDFDWMRMIRSSGSAGILSVTHTCLKQDKVDGQQGIVVLSGFSAYFCQGEIFHTAVGTGGFCSAFRQKSWEHVPYREATGREMRKREIPCWSIGSFRKLNHNIVHGSQKCSKSETTIEVWRDCQGFQFYPLWSSLERSLIGRFTYLKMMPMTDLIAAMVDFFSLDLGNSSTWDLICFVDFC